MKRIAWKILLLFFSAVIFAQADFPSLEPLFVYEPVEGVFSGEDIFRAALEFSLCPQESETGRIVLERYAELENEVVSAVSAMDDMEKGEKILSLMYERVLTQYVGDQTRMDVMFLEGTYNCVSSSVLYFALARAAGLSVAGQETPAHAFCAVSIGGKKIDVETTNPNGFNPGVKKILEQTEKTTHYFIVPKKYYSGRKEVGERKFVSLVGRNLVSGMNNENNFAQGVPLSATRLAFVGNALPRDAAAVREDFDTVCGNYAVDLDQKQMQSEKALDWLDAVCTRWGESEELRKKYNSIAHNCAVNYLRTDDFDNARRAFETHRDRLTKKNAANIGKMIFTAWVDSAVKGLSPDETIAFLHERRTDAYAQEKSAAAHLDILEEYAWYTKIRAEVDAENYLVAALIADEGLKFLPSSRNLKTIKNQCMQNYAVDVHNAFADLTNAGKYDEAMQVVQKGLKIVPSNAMLNSDLKKLQNFLKK